jgi:site-specific DNA recombinase
MTRLCQRFHDSHAIQTKKALCQSHDDTKLYREEAIKRLQAEYDHLQNRLNAMYLDKLDGRIKADFFDLRACEWRT